MITRSEVDKIPIDACHRPCVLVQFQRRDGPKARTRLLTLRRSKSLEYPLWARGRVKIRSGACHEYSGDSDFHAFNYVDSGTSGYHREGEFLHLFCFVVQEVLLETEYIRTR